MDREKLIEAVYEFKKNNDCGHTLDNRCPVCMADFALSATRDLREQLEAAEKAHSLIFEVINGPKYLNEDWLFKVGFINKVLSELKKHGGDTK
jgi:hypothetical protein